MLPDAAACAAHPTEAAVATCARCGSFMCARCQAAGDGTLCPACTALAGPRFPLSREAWSFGELWEIAWARFRIDWAMLAVGVLITTAVSMVMSGVQQGVQMGVRAALPGDATVVLLSGVPVQLVGVVVNGAAHLGLVQIAFDSLEGKRLDLSRMFDGFKMLGRYLAVVLVAALRVVPVFAVVGALAFGAFTAGERNLPVAIALGGLAAVIAIAAGIWLMPLGFLAPELVKHPELAPAEIVRNCFRIVRDNRANLFGVAFMAGLVTVAGILVCCVGALPAIGLQQVLMSGLYLALRNGSDAVDA